MENQYRPQVHCGEYGEIYLLLFTFIKTQLSLAIINAGTIEDLLQLQSSDSVLWIVKNLPGVKKKQKKKKRVRVPVQASHTAPLRP